MRAGPGTRYPIDWVYKRRDLPVEIEREFEVWRLVKDPDGTKGWVHQATLTGRRTLRRHRRGARCCCASRTTTRRPVAELKPGVIGRISLLRGRLGLVPGAGRRVSRLSEARASSGARSRERR